MPTTKEFDDLRIPFDDIKLATNNFDRSNYISHGGFGNVYKGELALSGQPSVMVAVKRFYQKYGQGPEFWQEINVLSRTKHENIVSLLGFCNEDNQSILVYEYLPHKSLDMLLSSPDLSWVNRLNICIGAARGIEHLHSSRGQRVIHRDIKSSNILLDRNLNAKVSDFGLAHIVSGSDNNKFPFHISQPAGTPGYCDPDHAHTGILKKEIDVYSFGVVLYEVLCGRLVIDIDGSSLLSKMPQGCYKYEIIRAFALDCLKDQISSRSLATFSKIAYECLQSDQSKRPTISEIVRQLKIALACQAGHNVFKEGRLDSHTLSPLVKNTRIYNSGFIRFSRKTGRRVIGITKSVNKVTPI